MPPPRSVDLDSVRGLSILPLPVTVSDAMLCDRTPGNDYTLSGTYRTSAVLEGGGSSQYGLLLERPNALMGGLGQTREE